MTFQGRQVWLFLCKALSKSNKGKSRKKAKLLEAKKDVTVVKRKMKIEIYRERKRGDVQRKLGQEKATSPRSTGFD